MMSADYFRALRTLSEEDFISLSGLNLYAINENKQTLLHEAISSKKSLIAIYLIDKGIELNAVDNRGQTPLHYAAAYNNHAVIKKICETGGDPNMLDIHGNSPLWTAGFAAKEDFTIITVLLRNGANPNLKNKAGKSILDFARQSKNINLWLACSGEKDSWWNF